MAAPILTPGVPPASISRRRRPAQASDSEMTPSLIDAFHDMTIRKGDTFHNIDTSARSDLWDPLQSQTLSPPGRSATCPKSLEDLLLGAGERRTTEFISKIDDSIAAKSKAGVTSILTDPDVLPVPTLVVHSASVPNEPATPVAKIHTRAHRNSHASDSGIGSSIAGSDESEAMTAERAGTTTRRMSDQSFSGISAATEERGLSKYACEQIHKYIVRPILREEALKDFHPLIERVPERVGNKEIKNLRDLERTLIFLAPDYSRSPSKYLQFCERTVRVLHTTVTTLHESDQRAPADRPYTQGYFFDLVEQVRPVFMSDGQAVKTDEIAQIRRYASILAATREKQAKGEKLDEMDYHPDETVSLVGGMTHNGKPVELVRRKDGKAISLATDQMLSPDELASANSKRPMAADFDADLDNDVLRSMARRKKNAKPEIHPCSICDKEFQRPCDLTKHIKTHERPWKCPDDKCKYHEHGWPTEKERDRHVNDKHSNAPTLYRCLYPPCPYTSKRESNCKQHMEKAHGWEYVRSKNNGKGRASVSRLPRGSVPQSPANSMLTPLTPIAPSPSIGSMSGSSRPHSVAPPTAGPSSWGTPAFPNQSPATGFETHFNWDFNNMAAFPMTPLSDARRLSSDGFSSHSGGFQLDGSVLDESISPDDMAFDHSTFQFGPDDFVFQQQATPDSSGCVGSSSNSAIMPHVSPGARLDQTFTNNYYDEMNMDGDFSAAPTSAPHEDFTLFGGGGSSSLAPVNNIGPGAELFPSLPDANNASAWNAYNGQYVAVPPPQFPTRNSTLDELFPELKGH